MEEELEDETEVIESAQTAKSGVGVADEMADFVASQIKSDQPLQDIGTMFIGRTRKKIIKRVPLLISQPWVCIKKIEIPTVTKTPKTVANL